MGRRMVRPGREGELSPKERSALLKGNASMTLEIRDDGTFMHQGATEGVWWRREDLVEFQPTALGGVTSDEMRRRSEESGREFRLAFLFDPFTLRLTGCELVTPEENSLILTVYSPKSG